MYTQCPDCSAAFRVSANDLKQAAGKVRCGGCGSAFDALEFLSEEMPQQPTGARAARRLPELKPDRRSAGLPESVSPEESIALLKTLEQLAGEDIRIEDTGIEWRVLDDQVIADLKTADADEPPGAQAHETSANESDAAAHILADGTQDTSFDPGDEADDGRDDEPRYGDDTPIQEHDDEAAAPLAEDDSGIEALADADEQLADGEPEPPDEAIDVESDDEDTGDWEEILDEFDDGDTNDESGDNDDHGLPEDSDEFEDPGLEREPDEIGGTVAHEGDQEQPGDSVDDESHGPERETGDDEVAESIGEHLESEDDDDVADTRDGDGGSDRKTETGIDEDAAKDDEDTDETGDLPDVQEEDVAVESIIMEGETVRNALDDVSDAKNMDGNISYWTPPEPVPPPARSAASTIGLSIAALVLLLMLGLQVIHHYRETLATVPAVNQIIAPVYRALGMTVTPDWDVTGWRFEATQSNTDNDDGNLTVYSRIGNTSDRPLPYPLIGISLTDRFDRTVGSRLVEPAEFLTVSSNPRKLVSPGDNFDAVISIAAADEAATGYKLDVCYRNPGSMGSAQLRCAIGDFKD
jgi:predicted Zn finger-like uncharacterized protein